MMRRILLFIFCCYFNLIVSAQQRVVIGLTGDITISGASRSAASNSTTESLLKDASPILQDADLTIGNLQGSLLDKATKSIKNRKSKTVANFSYLIPTKYAKVLKDAGYDVLTLANNHSNDFGDEGKKSTIKSLQEAGITFAGYVDGYEYASVERNGLNIAILAFGHGKNVPSINDIGKAVELIKKLKETYDIIIISFHAGAEGLQQGHVPFKNERFGKEKRGDVFKFAHACIDAGADLIFGHGPQVPRAMELYKNHLIAYSLGCFCTPNKINLRKGLGYAPLLKVEIAKNGELISGKIYSFIQKMGKGPMVDDKNLVVKEIARLTKIDFPKTPLIIQEEGWFSKEIVKTVISTDKGGSRITTAVVDKNTDDYNPISTLINYSKNLLGCRYCSGGRSIRGFDCSGFTKFVYAKIGYTLNPSSRAQYTQGRSVDVQNIRPGDLVFWKGSRHGRCIGHVGMVIEADNSKKSFKFIHAATTSRGVVIDSYPGSYYSSRYVGARRILP